MLFFSFGSNRQREDLEDHSGEPELQQGFVPEAVEERVDRESESKSEPKSTDQIRQENKANENKARVDLSDFEPLTLSQAAERLDLSMDELHTGFKKGLYQGFVRDGELYIYVKESDHFLGDNSVASSPSNLGAGDEPQQNLQTVIEFQKIELSRLIKANKELKAEKDRLYRILEREQVLRQGLQRTVERVSQQAMGASEDEETADDEAIEFSGLLTKKD
ncbi:MAG: hypothetical protein R3245_05370 [Kiloniellales bacterium]|nr:hypothetical protein [Kiloniellales bacterium]